jgi:ComF family protein
MKPVDSLLKLLFPDKCPFCRRLLKDGEFRLCEKCLRELPYTGGRLKTNGAFFTVCVSPLFYTGDARKAVLRFKFSGKSAYAACFGEIIADCVRQNLTGMYDLITWVPLAPQRLRKRGYSQSKLLAEALAAELSEKDSQICVRLLEKCRNTPSQSATKNSAQRRANVSGAFAVTDRERLAGKRILLIDDVVTSGATLSECARVLLTEGAEKVVCATLCKVRKIKS